MASNDLRGKNEYAYLLNEVNLIGVCEIIFLSKISHFGVKRVQTANKQTEIALIYRDVDFLRFFTMHGRFEHVSLILFTNFILYHFVV